MFPFFFILFAAIIVGAVAHVRRTRSQLREYFAEAARDLGFSYTEEGAMGSRPWIYGFKNGLRIDVRPFASRLGGPKRLWTGFRVTFAEPVAILTQGPNDIRQRGLLRLNRAFRECEIDQESLFCALARLPDSPTMIVDAVDLVTTVAWTFVNTGDDRDASPEMTDEAPDEPATPPPLPLPAPAVDAEPTPPTAPAPNAVAEPEAPEPAAAPVVAIDPPRRPAEWSPLEKAGADLFASGRNHFDTARQFDQTYAGHVLTGSGILRKVGRYSNDRIHGRGPGLLAEIEATTYDADTGRAVTFHILIPIPETDGQPPSLADWRPAIGRIARVSGSPLRCDSFTRRLHLAAGSVTSTEPETDAEAAA